MDIHQLIILATEAVQHGAETAAETSGKSDVLGTLGVNWKLFLAQLVNFGIVLFAFWKWVVKPLGKALSDRQARIESGLKNADYMEAEKKKFEEWKQVEMKKVRTEADHILRTTNDTANQIKQDTIVEAQKQASVLVAQARASIESEKVQMLAEIKQDVATLVVAATQKIIKTKVDGKKDHELIAETIKEVKK